jgi:hypothetical protein
MTLIVAACRDRSVRACLLEHLRIVVIRLAHARPDFASRGVVYVVLLRVLILFILDLSTVEKYG